MFAILLLFGLSIAYRLQETDEDEFVSAEQLVESYDAPITVIVLNGCGVNGLAGRVRDLMAPDPRFDVVDVDDADDHDYEETLVVDVSGRRESAETVAAFLEERLGAGRVVRHNVARPSAQVVVILGADASPDRASQ
jgi:hypothetical protein